MTFDPVPFDLGPAVVHWLLVVGSVAGIALVLSLVAAVFGGGRPRLFGTISSVVRGVTEGVSDFIHLSPRRVWAIATLTWKEAYRRKALLVFVIFALLFMFGGWFLSDTKLRPELQVKVHVSFVLTAISWLILPIALLLSCWGLPEDIKNRSLHTVVTKPVRRNEIVIGRILGFTGIGTLVLAVMGGVGYVWTMRQIPDEAKQSLICRVPIYGKLSFTDRQGAPAEGGINVGDIWDYRDFIEGATRARAIWEFEGIGPDVMVTLNDPASGKPVRRLIIETQLEAFRTHKGDIKTGVIGQLYFVRNTREKIAQALSDSPGFSRAGSLIASGQFAQSAEELQKLSERWTDTAAAFTGEQYAQIADGFGRISEQIRPFLQKRPDEPWIGEIAESADACRAAARNSDAAAMAESLGRLAGLIRQNADELAAVVTDLRVPYPSFEVKEFKEHLLIVDPELTFIATDEQTQTTVEKRVNLFDDVVHGGKLRVEVRCVDAGQYLGAARPDLFIRTPDRPFWVGYTKALLGIWLMTVLVIVLGVTAGSLLNGPVSTFLVFALLVVGQGFRDFLHEIVAGQQKGGGLFESVIRIFKHMNPTQPLEDGVPSQLVIDVIKTVDGAIIGVLWLASNIIPDFGYFGRTTQFVANGFDVDWASTLLPSIAITAGFLLPGAVVGYYCLKLRELEQK